MLSKLKEIRFFYWKKRRIWTLFLPFLFMFAEASAQELGQLYAQMEPYKKGHLDVGKGHQIYWEESGNPDGISVLFLHGGPGLGTSSTDRGFFDPKYYRIVLMDQRGCGNSIPFASIENNTTWDLVEDIEKLRRFLSIDNWLIFGGSWGSTLALTYAICYPSSVCGLILRGIFLCRPKEILWFYQNGANRIFPEFWEEYLSPIPIEEQTNLILAYYQRLIGTNIEDKKNAARAWSQWEGRASRLHHDPSLISNFSHKRAYSLARIECHYFIHNGFFPTENWILENLHMIRHIPCIIVHGRYDMICPLENAWELHKSWPEATFEIIQNAGHSSKEPYILNSLIHATNNFIKILK